MTKMTMAQDDDEADGDNDNARYQEIMAYRPVIT